MSYYSILIFSAFLMPMILIVSLIDVVASKSERHFVAFYRITFLYSILISVVATAVYVFVSDEVFDMYHKEISQLGIVPMVSVLMFMALKNFKKTYKVVSGVS